MWSEIDATANGTMSRDRRRFEPGDATVGVPLLEIRVQPSFAAPEQWVVAESPSNVQIVPIDAPHKPATRGALRLFVALSADAYTEAAIQHHELEAFLARVRECAVPMPPTLEHVAVADGTTYDLLLHGGTQAACRWTWKDGYEPKGWEHLAALVAAILAEFRRAPRSDTTVIRGPA